MPETEAVLFWITSFGYLAAIFTYMAAFMAMSGRIARGATAMVGLALLIHTSTIALRWVNAKHLPVGNTYELNLVGGWLIVSLYLIYVRFREGYQVLSLIALPITLVVMGIGMFSKTNVEPLSPAYASNWLIIHVLFAFIGFACFAMACSASGVYLLKERYPKNEFLLKVPSLRDLDAASHKLVILGFINHTVMLVSGAIWANDLWGKYWNWDPIETWSLITFLVYAIYLHLRTFRGWRGRRTAWLAIAGLIVIALSYWGVQYITPTIHVFDRF